MFYFFPTNRLLITSCDIFHVTDMEVYARAHHTKCVK